MLCFGGFWAHYEKFETNSTQPLLLCLFSAFREDVVGCLPVGAIVFMYYVLCHVLVDYGKVM